MPVAPDIRFFPSLIKDALVISLIAFSISISLAALFSRKNKYRIDSTQVKQLFFNIKVVELKRMHFFKDYKTYPIF